MVALGSPPVHQLAPLYGLAQQRGGPATAAPAHAQGEPEKRSFCRPSRSTAADAVVDVAVESPQNLFEQMSCVVVGVHAVAEQEHERGLGTAALQVLADGRVEALVDKRQGIIELRGGCRVVTGVGGVVVVP